MKLYEHQVSAQPILAEMDIRQRGGILADGMGLGKTITMATYMRNNKLKSNGYILPDLIVCPLSLMKMWERELMRVANSDAPPKILVYHGAKRDTSGRAFRKYDYVITTYSIMMRDVHIMKRLWGRTVLDESHNIRNGTRAKGSKCGKAAYVIGEHSKSRFCITGTPFNNRMEDLWSLCIFIGAHPYNTKSWWKQNWEKKDVMDTWNNQFVLRRTKEDMMAPPEYTDITVSPNLAEFKYTEKLRKIARQEFNNWVRAKNNKDNEERMRLQGRILALIQRLRMTSNSFHTYDSDVSCDTIMDSNAKVCKIVDDLDNAIFADPKNGVVVFSQFTSFLFLLERVLEEVLCGVDVYVFTGQMDQTERDDMITMFNTSRKPRVLLASLMAGGTGISLHHGSSTVMLSEPYYNPFMEQQAEERVHRLGQANQVHIYRYYMKNSVETWIESIKKKKIVLASNVKMVDDDVVPIDFSFDDIRELFETHVNFKRVDD